MVVPGVNFPVLLMLLGLLFRGVAFEFRGVTGARKRLWSGAFAYGSLVATAAQGAVLGMFVQGFKVVDGRFAGTSWDWVAPFPLLTAAGLVAGYLLLGSTWLVMKGEGPLRAAAQRSARHALVGVIVFIVVVSVWTPLADRGIAARWFAWPNLLVFSPVPVLTAWLAWLAARVAARPRRAAVRRVDRAVLSRLLGADHQPVAARRAAVGDVVVGRVGAGVAGISDDRHRVHAARAAAVRVLVVLGVSRQGARRRRL